ncbi:hypothetical protein BDZ91DRAFT_731719 [Kalaharituber pfeilii]|nr:hypothetical protein BDZ91DRAFT_731719 [Kalaharituber pfeilii]
MLFHQLICLFVGVPTHPLASINTSLHYFLIMFSPSIPLRIPTLCTTLTTSL